MKNFKKIKNKLLRNKLLIKLVVVFLILVLAGFLFFRYFDGFLEERFNLNTLNLNMELKQIGTVLDTSIFDNQKFNDLKTHKVVRPKENISIKNNPFEDYNKKSEESEEEQGD